MPSYHSPSLYIDFSRLKPPKVIEEVEFERILQRYRADAVRRSNGRLSRAVSLEQSPTNVVLETEAYGEVVVRSRVNAAARAVMLPFSTGTDLDVLAAFHNLARQPLVSQPRPYSTHPEDWQSDEAFRRDVQLAAEAYSSAGSEGAYIFHALRAHTGLRDASATRIDDRGGVKVTLMNSGLDPLPTEAQLRAVSSRLNHETIKPLTDTVSVAPVTVRRTNIRAGVVLYPGPDQALVVADIKAAMTRVRSRISLIGRDLTRSAIIAALNQEGVQSSVLHEPAADITVGRDGCVVIGEAEVRVSGTRTE